MLIKKNYEELSKEGGRYVASLIRRKPDCVLGFATGKTMVGMYRELIRMHKEQALDFSKVVTFNLDEYIGLPPSHDKSSHTFMWENLFKHINLNPTNVYIPMGMSEDIEGFCEWYENKINEHGGIDLQILNLGVNGRIAFNDCYSSLGSRTRIKTLSERTSKDLSHFFDSIDNVPRYAITMGLGTIMESGKLLLIASGSHKDVAVKATIDDPLTAKVPATVIQLHRNATILIDRAAASKLEGTLSN